MASRAWARLYVLAHGAAGLVSRRRRHPPAVVRRLLIAQHLLLGVVQNMVAGYGDTFLPHFLIRLSGFRTSIPFILTIVGLIVLATRKSRAAGSVSP